LALSVIVTKRNPVFSMALFNVDRYRLFKLPMDIESNPKTAVSNLVGKLKGKSSYILRNEFWSEIKNKLWGDHFWSPSYCVVSCGGASLDVVRAYIEDQRKPSDKKSMEQSKRFAGTNRNQDKTWNRKTR